MTNLLIGMKKGQEYICDNADIDVMLKSPSDEESAITVINDHETLIRPPL